MVPPTFRVCLPPWINLCQRQAKRSGLLGDSEFFWDASQYYHRPLQCALSLCMSGICILGGWCEGKRKQIAKIKEKTSSFTSLANIRRARCQSVFTLSLRNSALAWGRTPEAKARSLPLARGALGADLSIKTGVFLLLQKLITQSTEHEEWMSVALAMGNTFLLARMCVLRSPCKVDKKLRAS